MCDPANQMDNFVTMKVRKTYDDSNGNYSFNLGVSNFLQKTAPQGLHYIMKMHSKGLLVDFASRMESFMTSLETYRA